MQKFLPIAAAVFSVQLAHADELWVQVRETKLRAQPSILAAGVADLKYGDRVDKVSEAKSWAQVRTVRSQKEGYLPLSSITPQRVVLLARGNPKIKADATEVVLAGRGFSKEVEEQFKILNQGARFDQVDQVERRCSASTKEVAQFVEAGGLR